MSSRTASGTPPAGAPAVVKFECDVEGLYVRRLEIAADEGDDIAILVSKPRKEEDGPDIRIEQVQDLITPGQMVKVTADAGEGTRQVVFHGRIVTAGVRAQGRDEEIEYAALGLKHELKIEKVFGCWSRASDDSAQHLQALPCVFNPEGKKNNDTTDRADPGGRKRIVFNHDPESEDAQHWTGARMLRYVATAERKDDVIATAPRVFQTTDAPGGELAEFTPYDVNVEGEDIWSAIVRIAKVCSRGVVWRYGETREACRLEFFKRRHEDGDAAVQFEFPAAGGPPEIEDHGRLLHSIDFQHDWAGCVTYWDAVGPPKVWEGDFTLVKGWKQADQDSAFGSGTAAQKLARFLKETDRETSSDWARFQNVGRRWILNETGRDDNVDGSTDPYDFSGLFGNEKYSERPRPFRRDIPTKDAAGQPSRPKVTVEWGGSLPDDFDVGSDVTLLEDRAGLYWRARPLIDPARFMESGTATDLFPSAVKMKAAVEGDQSAPHGIIGVGERETDLPGFGLVRLDDGLRTDNVNTEEAGEAEEHAQALVDQAADEMSSRKDAGTVVCPYVTNRFRVGQWVDKIDGRDLKMKAVIVKMAWDVQAQSTEFGLEIPTLDTETHSRDREQVQGAGVDASTDDRFRNLRDLLGLVETGHGPMQVPGGDGRTVQDMADAALRGLRSRSFE